jgi:hypothetical protein
MVLGRRNGLASNTLYAKVVLQINQPQVGIFIRAHHGWPYPQKVASEFRKSPSVSTASDVIRQRRKNKSLFASFSSEKEESSLVSRKFQKPKRAVPVQDSGSPICGFAPR